MENHGQVAQMHRCVSRIARQHGALCVPDLGGGMGCRHVLDQLKSLKELGVSCSKGLSQRKNRKFNRTFFSEAAWQSQVQSPLSWSKIPRLILFSCTAELTKGSEVVVVRGSMTVGNHRPPIVS